MDRGLHRRVPAPAGRWWRVPAAQLRDGEPRGVLRGGNRGVLRSPERAARAEARPLRRPAGLLPAGPRPPGTAIGHPARRETAGGRRSRRAGPTILLVGLPRRNG